MRNPLPSGRWFLLMVGLIAWELSATAAARAQSANPELDALLTKGVEFPGGQMRKLRPPTLVDGLSAAAQQASNRSRAGDEKGRPLTYKEFTVHNLNTPYVLLVDMDLQVGGNYPGTPLIYGSSPLAI